MITAAVGEALFDQVGSFTKEADVEHRARRLAADSVLSSAGRRH
jgi:hypothetical protein